MKHHSFVLLLLIGHLTFGQTLQLTECQTSKPIAFAHIQNTSTGKSTISNSEGEFNLFIRDNDLLIISHISYQPMTITGAQLSTVCMEEYVEVLKEVIVEANSNHKFLMTVLKNTKEKLLIPGRFNAYYKEFVMRDDEYTHFCDADISYYFEDKRENIKVTGELIESRAYVLPIEESNNDEYIDLDIISPIGYKKTIEIFNPYKIERFLSEEAHENYDYELFERDNHIIVKAKPLADGNGVYEADILINANDSTLSSVKFFIPEYRKGYTKEVNAVVAKLKILQNNGYFIYSKVKEDSIYPSFVRMTYDIKIWNKKKINQVSSFITDINIYEIPADQSEIEKSDQFNKKSIYKQGTNYKSEYWLNKSLLGLTLREKEIIEHAREWDPKNK